MKTAAALILVAMIVFMMPSRIMAQGTVDLVVDYATQDLLMFGSGPAVSAMQLGFADIDTFYPNYEYYLAEHYRAAAEQTTVRWQPDVTPYEAAYGMSVSYPAARATYQEELAASIVSPVSNAQITQTPELYLDYGVYRVSGEHFLYAQQTDNPSRSAWEQASMESQISLVSRSLSPFGLIQVVGPRGELGETVTAGLMGNPELLTTWITTRTPDFEPTPVPPTTEEKPGEKPGGSGGGGGQKPEPRTWEEKTRPVIIK